MAKEQKIRIGAVSYLNTKPLVYRLDEMAPEAEIHYDLPSRLADQLAQEKLDVALIPSVEYFLGEGYQVVSDACIACRGPVLSVKLLSRVPLPRIGTLALDEGSRTSVALVRILLEQRFRLTPELTRLPIGCDVRNSTSDAVLLIGDRAIHPPIDGFVEQWDLGEQWCRWSELPFVFAMWTARPGIDILRWAEPLQQARDQGLAHLSEIAAREGPRTGLSPKACLSYLRDNLYFYLGARERCGLELFRRHAAALGLAPPALENRASEVNFDGCQTS